jgi:MFS family permease
LQQLRDQKDRSPFTIHNVKLFVAFRVLFNARFYYPVFTILFLDYGLTIEQFALLNTVWAITIVCAEVPSGALADLLGRKRLLVFTSALMIVELSVIAFIPITNMTVVFWAFFINRILSGLAEAMASGADEAIAYDSLVSQGNPGHWPRVLSVQMRIKALAGIISMTVGALIYDPDVVNHILGWFGIVGTITQQNSMRYPIYLTLLLGLLALWTTTQMRESDSQPERDEAPITFDTIWRAGQLTLKAGLWILKTPFALAIILFGMMYDHVLRMVITLTSQYYRLIELPEASFGVIMAGMSILGLVIPRIAEYMVKTFTPAQNTAWLGLVALMALVGLSWFVPYFGVIPMALVMIGLMLTAFFSSHYLNQITSSEQRATVLSFKGLAFNLAYGIIGVLFALLMQQLRVKNQLVHIDWTAELIGEEAFRQSIGWFPWYAALLIIVLALYCRYALKETPAPAELS